MLLPSIYDELDPQWWGDSEILYDIEDAQEANRVALEARKKLSVIEVDDSEWNTVVSKKHTKNCKNIVAQKEIKSEHRGVITNMTKGKGFIKDQTGVLFVFNSTTTKFAINDRVSFSLSSSKKNPRIKKAIKIKHMYKNTCGGDV